MTITPRMLSSMESEKVPLAALHCGECLTDYPALPDAYDWMFDDDLIVCAACGSELVLTTTTTDEG